MTKVIYIGPHDGVELELSDGSMLVAERDGDPIEIPAVKVPTGIDEEQHQKAPQERHLLDALLEQPDNWKLLDAAPAEKKGAKS